VIKSFKDFISTFEKIEPLSNFQIMDRCKELQIKNFKGVFMRDELLGRKSTQNECLVLNTDDSSGNGIHWVSLFTKNGIAFYFDSYGSEPLEEVKKYCSGYYSTDRIQQDDRVVSLCGYYCIYVLYRLSNGCNFYDVLNELYKCTI